MNDPRERTGGLQGNGFPRHHHAAASTLRLPTVKEAMTFSPFTSIVPFNPGLVPAPGTLQRLSPNTFGDPQDQKAAKEILHQLDMSACSAEVASRRCQQTLRDVQRLLNPDGLMQFIFPPRESLTQSNGFARVSPQHVNKLSPFAKMVLEQTDISYRYADSKSAEHVAKSLGKDELDQSQTESHIKPETPISNGHRETGLSVSVVIPNTITPDEKAQYLIYSDLDPSTDHQYSLSSSKERSRKSDGARNVSIDQKQRGDTAISSLQTLLQSIFEIEDALGMGDGENNNSPAFFEARDTDEGSTWVLHPDRIKILDSQVQKVSSFHRLAELDVEDLEHVQKLCERAIGPAQSVPLLIDDDWSGTDVEEWLVKLSHAQSGLVAARITMCIMAGLPQSKELQSESFLHEILLALGNVIGECMVPLVEMTSYTGEKFRGQKDEPPANPKFVTASAHRQPLQNLLATATKALRAVGVLLTVTDFDESHISKVESLCEMLIFAQNASNERDSVLGIQNFESTRRCAMDVLTKIFTKYPKQRDYILNEILSSLSKLPATKQSARQYRLADAKPIQLVSALLMRLVQTSACVSASDLEEHQKFDDEDEDDDAEGSTDGDIAGLDPSRHSFKTEEELSSIVISLNKAAQEQALYIARQLIERASTTTKSGDEPYRKLLDIFIDDFLNVLGSSDWPAAEQLLFSLSATMWHIVDDAKRPAPARTMSLEYLGILGSGILEAQIAARDAARAVDEESHHGHLLAQLIDQTESGELNTGAVTGLGGPYRILLEYLSNSDSTDSQVQTARGYRLTEWFSIVFADCVSSVGTESNNGDVVYNHLKATLLKLIRDPQWLSEYTSIDPVSASDVRLASKVVALNSKFFKAFNKILRTLLNSISSEQPTLRSRSLKSVDALLEKDPSVLERNQSVLNIISSRMTSDKSPLVRDSALGLISKCLQLRPKLDSTVYQRIVWLSSDDPALGVRQRAIKVLKEIYLRNGNMEMRSTIAGAVMRKTLDAEEKVAEPARNTVEEILFQPFYSLQSEGDGGLETKQAYSVQASLLVQMLANNEDLVDIVDNLLRRLQRRSKAATSVSKVCKNLISVLFDDFVGSKVSGEEVQNSSSQEHILMALSVFARACPQLFTVLQLKRLEPYLDNLKDGFDLWTCRFAITILRHTLPYHKKHLMPNNVEELQQNLLKVVSKAPVSQLKDVAEEVASCAWTIHGTMSGSTRVPNFVKSIMMGLVPLSGENLEADVKMTVKATRLSCMLGEFGKVCELNSFLTEWKSHFPWFRGDSVPGLMVELLCRFTSPRCPLELRVAVIAAICSISQRWSEHFLRADVLNAFEMVFEERNPQLEIALLTGLEVFFGAQEKPRYEDEDDKAELPNGIASGKDRLGRTYQASDDDKALTSMSQHFLDQIRRLALAGSNEPAFIAARLIITINSQGLGHPKDSAPALVALETCPNKAIAKRAFDAHKDQGLSRESVFEKEYMRGVQLAFEYQQEVVGEVVGYTQQPQQTPVSKLHCLWDVLKNGKAGVRTKFLGNMSRKLDFDPAMVQQQHVFFVHFCLGNLAFFEYDKIDELVGLVAGLEKVFSATGTIIAQAIESEVLSLHVESIVDSTTNDGAMGIAVQPSKGSLDPQRLRTLSLGGQTLSLIWETRSFLRRLYSLQKYSGKAKKAAKEGGSKTAYRAPNAPSLNEAHQQRSRDLALPLDSEERQRAMCNSFVELFNVDNEVKVGSENEVADDAENGYATSGDESSGKSASAPPGNGGAGARGKKRRSSGQATTPRKRGRPNLAKRKSSSFNRGASDDDEDEKDDDDGRGWD